MGEVVDINQAAKRRTRSLEEAWEHYLAAVRLSHQTLRIEDGIAAGKAYREFLDLAGRTK